MKIVADDKIPFLKGVFEPFAEVVYRKGAAITPADVADADALMVRTRTECNAALLAGSKVRFVATATIGYDHIAADELAIYWFLYDPFRTVNQNAWLGRRLGRQL